MARLFISLNLPEEIRDRISQFTFELNPRESKLKWEPKEKLHVTLKFIGIVEDSLLTSIAGELNFIENYNGISCETKNFEFFFARHQPRILWLGLHTDKIIFNLVEELNSRLVKFLIPREKKVFTSHVTVLRLRGKTSEHFIEKCKKFEVPKMKFQANEISLVKSELLLLESIYKEIKKYKLK